MLRNHNHHVPLGVVARRKAIPPPTLKLHSLVHGKLHSVASIVDRWSDGGHLVVARSRSGCLQNSLELQLPLQVTLG
jgi:hypothetical protein